MPLNVRLVNAEVRDPDSGQMIPAGLIGSDALSTAEYKLSDVYESNFGRVGAGNAGNTSTVISSDTDWLYYDIPVSDHISSIYSKAEYVPANTAGGFIHILTEDNIILNRIRQDNIYFDRNIYDYIDGNGIIDFEYIQNNYPTVKKVRVCFYIPSVVDFYVCKLTPHEVIARENRYNAKTIQAELLKSGKKTLADLNKQHGRCLNFALITDTHVYPHEGATWSCTNNIDLFVKASTYADFAVHCGDVVESGNMYSVFEGAQTSMSREDNIDNLNMAMERMNKIQCPLVVVRGNHDVNSYGRSATNVSVDLTTIVYNSEWNALTQNKRGDVVVDEDNLFGNYYYFDVSLFKIRAIVLNQYIDEETGQDKSYGNANIGYGQVNWFAETALNLSDKDDPSEWSVVVFTHGVYDDIIKYIIVDFMTGGDISSEITDAAKLAEYAQLKQTCGFDVDYFSTQGAIPFIGMIHGDSHKDEYSNLGCFNKIGVDQSFIKMWLNVAGDEIGTPNEYCVDYFTIDTANHTVYETRMGRGSDRAYHYGTTAAEHYRITT